MTFTPWKARGAAVVSALLLAAAFPPLNWWPLALVALGPLLLAVWSGPAPTRGKAVPALIPDAVTDAAGEARPGKHGGDGLAAGAEKPPHGRGPRASSFWTAFRLGWWFGFVFFTATLWWIQYVTLAGMLALTAYLALYPAVAMGIAGWLGMRPDEHGGPALGRILLLAGAWTGLEWLRGVALWGFPWNGLAVPLFPSHLLRRLAATTGGAGLALMVAFMAITLAACLRLQAKSRMTAAVLLGVITLASAGWEGFCRMQDAPAAHHGKPPGQNYTALLIQPNLTMEEKMSPDPEAQRQRYFDLVARTDAALAATAGPDGKTKAGLVVWPESAVPGFFDEMVQGGAFTDQLQQGDFSLVTGADHRDWDKLYNSVVAMRGTTGNRALHPKVRLVPFGEFIPFRREVPLFEKLLGDLIPMDFNPGTSLEPMRLEGQPFSIVPLVCFEDTIGDHARRFIRPGPQVLVNVTNDNWFHQSPATEMHFANARWRAVELRRTLLRSANTGVTAMVSPLGEVQQIPSFQPGTLSGTFTAGDGGLTFYAKHGEVVAQAAGLGALAGCVAVGLHRRRTKPRLP